MTSHEVVFKSWRRLYANRGIIGISPPPDLEISEGYDSTLQTPADEGWDENAEKLSAAECVELADMMLARWQAFRDRWSEAKWAE